MSSAAVKSIPRWVPPIIVGGVVVLDQSTKSWMVANHSETPLSIVGDAIEFRVARNPGGAFSSFTNATAVLAVLAIGLSIWLARTIRSSTDRATVVALSMVLGGAIGNLIDRFFRSPGVLRGHVVDFVRVGSFPSFNVADSAITCGAILLILLSFRSPASAPATPDTPE